MMFKQKFVKDSAWVTVRAIEEAEARGSKSIEAEHLLLALARSPKGLAAATLSDAGLDHAAIERALTAEHEQALAAVGVAGAGLPRAVAESPKRPRWGASAKRALERAVRASDERRDGRVEPAHILLGVLEAEAGTVPRALAQAGVDPADLDRRTRSALDAAA
jgi:ATP-dependent Clp protease ATP-binding subunit ClpA